MAHESPWEEEGHDGGKDTVEEPVQQRVLLVDIPSLPPREEKTVLFTQFYPHMESPPSLYSLTLGRLLQLSEFCV